VLLAENALLSQIPSWCGEKGE